MMLQKTISDEMVFVVFKNGLNIPRAVRYTMAIAVIWGLACRWATHHLSIPPAATTTSVDTRGAFRYASKLSCAGVVVWYAIKEC